MAWSPCPWKRFPGARQPDHRLPAFSHGSQVVVAARATRVIITPTTARETRLVHRTHHSLSRGYLSLDDIIRDSDPGYIPFLLSRPLTLLLLLSPRKYLPASLRRVLTPRLIIAGARRLDNIYLSPSPLLFSSLTTDNTDPYTILPRSQPLPYDDHETPNHSITIHRCVRYDNAS